MRTFILLLSFILCSCGARKSNTTTTDEKEKKTIENITQDASKVETNAEQNIKTNKVVEIDEKTGEQIETITDEPIDNSKPATVIDEDGKKTELNNAKRTKTKRTLSRDKKTRATQDIVDEKKVNQIAVKQSTKRHKEVSSKHKKGKVKDVEREALFEWYDYLFLICLIIFILRCIYCYKRKIPLL